MLGYSLVPVCVKLQMLSYWCCLCVLPVNLFASFYVTICELQVTGRWQGVTTWTLRTETWWTDEKGSLEVGNIHEGQTDWGYGKEADLISVQRSRRGGWFVFGKWLSHVTSGSFNKFDFDTRYPWYGWKLVRILDCDPRRLTGSFCKLSDVYLAIGWENLP